jgi:hypothetical protein
MNYNATSTCQQTNPPPITTQTDQPTSTSAIQSIHTCTQHPHPESRSADSRCPKNTLNAFLSKVDCEVNCSVLGPGRSGSNGHAQVQDNCNYPGKLPTVCPEPNCSGKLRMRHSKRNYPNLFKIGQGLRRFLVFCSDCGHLRKRTAKGSSEISRHENGRIGPHQRGVRAACYLNPAPQK